MVGWCTVCYGGVLYMYGRAVYCVLWLCTVHVW